MVLVFLLLLSGPDEPHPPSQEVAEEIITED